MTEIYADRANRIVVRHHLGCICSWLTFFRRREDFQIPPGENRILAAYEMGDVRAAYVEPIGVGDALPSMPLFLIQGLHLKVPLESTYMSTWAPGREKSRLPVKTGVC